MYASAAEPRIRIQAGSHQSLCGTTQFIFHQKGRVGVLLPASFAVWESGLARNRIDLALRRCQANDPTFQRVTAHALRHTAVSLAISAGANVKVVQRMLGHSSAAMTLDVYADLFDSDLDTVAASVGKMWARAANS